MTAELAARVSSSAEYGGVEVEYVDPGRGRERRLPRRCLARSLRRIAPATASRPDAPASGPWFCLREPGSGPNLVKASGPGHDGCAAPLLTVRRPVTRIGLHRVRHRNRPRAENRPRVSASPDRALPVRIMINVCQKGPPARRMLT